MISSGVRDRPAVLMHCFYFYGSYRISQIHLTELFRIFIPEREGHHEHYRRDCRKGHISWRVPKNSFRDVK